MTEEIKNKTNKKLPRSLKKYIRLQKAKIRNMFSDKKDIEDKIRELYSRMPRYE